MRAVCPLIAVLALLVAACGGDPVGSSESSSSVPVTAASTTVTAAPMTTTTTEMAVPFDAGALATGWAPVLEEGEGLGIGGGSIFRLGSADFGVLAVGFTCESVEEGTSSDCHPAAWVSADGLEWDKVYGPEAGLSEGRIEAVTAGGLGVVAVGGSCNFFSPPPWNCLPAVWTSADGRDWTPLPQPEGTFEACDNPDSCHLYHVGSTSGMLVASGWDGAGFGVWTSPEGEVWTKVSSDYEPLVPTEENEGRLVPGDAGTFHLLASGPGLIALGNVTVLEYDGTRVVQEWQPTAVLTAGAGNSWEPLEDAGEVLEQIEAELMAAVGSGIWDSHLLIMSKPSSDHDTWAFGGHSRWGDMIAHHGTLISVVGGEQINLWMP